MPPKPKQLHNDHYRIGFILMLALVLPTILSAEEAFEITFFRPYQPGQQYAVTFEAESEKRQQISRRSREADPEVTRQQVRLRGEMEVLAVGADGDISEARYHIQEFAGTAKGAAIPGLQPGDTLHARLESDETRYYKDGVALPDALAELLALIIRFRSPDRPRDTESFAADTPKAVGERWQVNRERAAASLTRDQVRVAPEAISGEVVLQETLTHAGLEAYRLAGNLHVTRMEMDMPRMSRLESAEMEMSHEGVYPVDTTRQPLDTRTTATLEAHAQGTGLARFLQFHIRETRTMHAVMTPIPEDAATGDVAPEAPQSPAGNSDNDDVDDDEWRVLSVE